MNLYFKHLGYFYNRYRHACIVWFELMFRMLNKDFSKASHQVSRININVIYVSIL
jgi:hypothetical protein